MSALPEDNISMSLNGESIGVTAVMDGCRLLICWSKRFQVSVHKFGPGHSQCRAPDCLALVMLKVYLLIRTLQPRLGAAPSYLWKFTFESCGFLQS